MKTRIKGLFGSLLISLVASLFLLSSPSFSEENFNKMIPVLAYFSLDAVENESVIDPFNFYSGVLFDGEKLAIQKGVVKEGEEMRGPQLESGGKYSSSINFDGVDDYIEVYPNLKLADPNLFSVSFWFKTDRLPASKHSIVQLLGDVVNGETQTISASVQIEPNGLSLTWFSSEDKENKIISEVPAGDWVHISVIFNNSEVTLYVDGEKKETKQSGKLDTASTYLILGANAKGNFFKGRIDEVKIYDGAISEEQVKDDFNGMKPELPKEVESVKESSVPETQDSILLVHWPFEDFYLQGNIFQDSTLQPENRGVLKDGDKLTTSEEAATKLVDGKSGKAIGFDGLDDLMTMSHNNDLSLKDSGSFTLSAWVKLNSREGYESQTIIRKRPAVYGDPWPYSLNLDRENRKVQFILSTGNREIDRFVVVESEKEMPVGEWILVTAVWDGEKMKLYLDGDLEGEVGFAGPVQSGEDPTGERAPRSLSIGAAEDLEGNLNGAIDELRIYNYALSELDINVLKEGVADIPSPEVSPAGSPEGQPSTGGLTGCSADNLVLCYTEADCAGAGLNWCPSGLGGGTCKAEGC